MYMKQYLNEPPEGMDIFLYPSNSLSVKYSLRHRKCGVRGFIHELFVSKPEQARYE